MAVPAAPTGLAIIETYSNALEISWVSVSGADGYYIYLSSDGGVTYRNIDSTTNTYYNIMGLDESTTYYIKVSAYNGDGEGSSSSSVNGTTLVVVTGKLLMLPGKVFEYDKNALYAVDVYTLSGYYAIITDSGISCYTLDAIGNISTEGDLLGDRIVINDATGSVWRFTHSGTDLIYQYYDTSTSTWVTVFKMSLDGSMTLSGVKSGATQAAAGASAGEIWKTSGHATLPDNVLMIGV